MKNELVEFLENGFIYNGNYYLYDKIVSVENISITNDLYNYLPYEDNCHYEIKCGINIIFINKTLNIKLNSNKYRPKEISLLNCDISECFYLLFHKKERNKKHNEYLKELEKFNKFIKNSNKTIDKYYKEIYNIKQTLIEILETKNINKELIK